MRKSKAVVLAMVFFLLASSLSGCAQGCATSQPKKPLASPGAKPLVAAFYENGWNSPTMPSSLASFKQHVQMINIVEPFWFTVNMDGTIEDKHNQEAMDFARANKIPVYALFNNKKDVVPTNDAMLTNAGARAKSLTKIIELVDKYNYDGINIDFEIMPAKDKELFTNYIKELAAKLKQKNKKLSVSVIPRLGTTADINGVYDYAALAGIADQIVLMAYNEHFPASKPGPVASAKWVEDNIKDALSAVPNDKLLLGVSVYGYDWPGPDPGTAGSVDYIPMTEAVARAGRKGAAIQWDEQAQVPHYTYSEKGVTRQVWFENEKSLRPKLDLVRKYQLPGVAIWRIGFEDEAVWQVIKEKLGK